jgi:hypothetical protein
MAIFAFDTNFPKRNVHHILELQDLMDLVQLEEVLKEMGQAVAPGARVAAAEAK